MSLLVNDSTTQPRRVALERGFPATEISRVAEQESWRKEINRPLYHIHKWWATRLGSVFRAIVMGALAPEDFDIWDGFYKPQDFDGRIVLDPFMGSGTTLGEALKVGAKAIGCDINPVSAFSVRQAFTHVSERQLRDAFARLESSVAAEIRRYYRTRDPQTREYIPVLYCFWVKTVKTPAGEEIPLFSRYVFAQDAYPKKKPKAQIVCPRCWDVMEGRVDDISITCSCCGATFDPQRGPVDRQTVTDSQGKTYRIKELLGTDQPPEHKAYALMALRTNGEKIYLRVTDEDRAIIAEAEARLESEQLPLPDLEVRPGHNTDQARGYNYRHWGQFFNPRQLLTLGLLLREIMAIKDRNVREQMICLFSSVLEFNNMFCSFKGEGTGAVRHMFSNHILKPERTPLENSVWGTEKSSGTFATLFESRLLKAKRYLDEPFEVHIEKGLLGDSHVASKLVASKALRPIIGTNWEDIRSGDASLLLLNQDSSRLPLPAKSVDAVVTDPPYFDFVHYSELSDFFYAWLAPALRSEYPNFDRDDSSDLGEVQQRDPRAFAQQLGAVFRECSRVLKDDGTLTFSFHHSRAEGWAAIHEALTMAGLEVVAAHAVHGELRSSSPKSAASDPISLDAILVCRKAEESGKPQFSADEVVEETQSRSEALVGMGMYISASDRFVIAAALTLQRSAGSGIGFLAMQQRLDLLRQRLSLHHRVAVADTQVAEANVVG